MFEGLWLFEEQLDRLIVDSRLEIGAEIIDLSVAMLAQGKESDDPQIHLTMYSRGIVEY